MTQIQLTLALPDSLAGEARAAGLLNPEAIERLLREAVRQRRIGRLFETADRLAGLPLPPLTEAEVEAEIQAARAARRAADAGGG